MKISRALGSIPAIVGIPALSLAWYIRGAGLELYIFLISVAALSFSQILIRESNADTELIISILREQVRVDERIPNEVANGNGA